MLPILYLFIVIAIIAFILFVTTYVHYLVHKYINKDTLCYIENDIYLMNYETIDLLISELESKDIKNIEDETLTIDYDNLDNYFDYLYKYIYQKYIESISE